MNSPGDYATQNFHTLRDGTGTAVGQMQLKSILGFCKSPMMNAIEAYIHFTPHLMSDDGEVSVKSTEDFLRKYMREFGSFIGRVLTVYPRSL